MDKVSKGKKIEWKNPYEREWEKVVRKEERLRLSTSKKNGPVQQKLSEIVPDKLQGILCTAFIKAFALIFEKGIVVIEKTYKKEDIQNTFKVNSYANDVYQNRKSLKAFEKKAEGSGRINSIVSAAAGTTMGFLGIGIPDIPIFTAILLKSIYEIALHYGFEYESEAERRFILLLIQGALVFGTESEEVNEQIQNYIMGGLIPSDYTERTQIEKTAQALSKELLYTKFLQGIPVVGAAAGIYDAVYMRRITGFVNLQYKKRFLAMKKVVRDKRTW